MLRIIENSRLNKANVAEVDNAPVCAIREGITTSLLLCATEENRDCNEYSRDNLCGPFGSTKRRCCQLYPANRLAVGQLYPANRLVVEECRTTDGGIFIIFFLCRGYLHSNSGLYPLLYTSFGRKRI